MRPVTIPQPPFHTTTITITSHTNITTPTTSTMATIEFNLADTKTVTQPRTILHHHTTKLCGPAGVHC